MRSVWLNESVEKLHHSQAIKFKPRFQRLEDRYLLFADLVLEMPAPIVETCHHDHETHVDVAYGMFTSEEIEAFEAVTPDPSLGTLTTQESMDLTSSVRTSASAVEDGGHGSTSDILTFVFDFKDSSQANTSDIFGNIVSTFDVTSYGFAESDFDLVANAILAEVEEDYFDELVGTVAGPPGQDLEIDFIIGDIGTAPAGITEYYYVQIGTGESGPHAGGTLGVAGGSAVRTSTGGSSGNYIGNVVASVFTDAIVTLGGLSPSNALTSGNIGYTTFAIGGTLSHEVGHNLSLSHLSKSGAVTPTSKPPIMGTGAIDLPNQDRIGEREFSLSGVDGQAGNAARQHIQQLVDAVGLHSTGLALTVEPVAAEQFEGDSGNTAFTFNVTLSEPQTQTVTVNWSVAGTGASPANDQDFDPASLSGELSFAPSVTSLPITVNVTGDLEYEANETFVVSLSEPSLGTANDSAIGTIKSDEAEITGRVWNDANNDGIVNNGEGGLANVTVYIDEDLDGFRDPSEPIDVTDGLGNYSFVAIPGSYYVALDLQSGQQTFPTLVTDNIEPDDYVINTVLNQVKPFVTLTAVGTEVTSSAQVTAVSSVYASTGSLSFGNNWGGDDWDTDPASLEVRFDTGVQEVSIDFGSDDASDFGHLRAYNANDVLLQEYITGDLSTGVVETMTVSSPGSEIAYVLASGLNGQFGTLDNLSYSFPSTRLEVTLVGPVSSSNDFGVYQAVPDGSPVAVADSYGVDEDFTLTVNAASGVLFNDSDPDLDPLTAVLVNPTSNGILTFNGDDGSFTYVPEPNFNGTDTFSYYASDGINTSETVLVTINVSAINDPPVALGDTYGTSVDTTLNVAADGVLTNDSDIDSNLISAILNSDVSNGTLELNSNGSFSYTPNGGFIGTDTFSYYANDGSADSNIVSVDIVVSPAPGITVSAVSGDTSEDGTTASFSVVLDTQPSDSVTIDLSSGDTSEGTVNPTSIVFTPGDWSSTKTVTVSGVDDFVVDGSVDYTILTAPANSADPNYNGLDAADIELSNLDNDTAITSRYVAQSGELFLSSANYSILPGDTLESAGVAGTTGDDGSAQILREGEVQLPARFYAIADVFGDGSVAGSYTNTVSNDGILQQISEVESKGGKPSTRTTLLSHGWYFGSIAANTLFVDAELTGSESENFVFEASVNGGPWTNIGSVNQTGEFTFDGLNLVGDISLRVYDTTRDSGQRGINQLGIDQLYLQGEAGVTSALDSYYRWEFPNVDTAQNFYLEGSENDAFDDFDFEISTDGGSSWAPLGTLSNTGTVTANFSADPITAASVFVRVSDTNRDEGESSLGEVSIAWMYFESVQNDLRTPVDISVTGPAQEDPSSPTPAEFTFSRPSDADLSQPLTVQFTVGGIADSSDYVQSPVGSVVTIPSGLTSAMVTFTPIDDSLAEGTETIDVILVDSEAAAFRPGITSSATVDILDDDLLFYVPTNETLQSGRIISGSYLDVQTIGGATQTLQERESGGKPANRHTFLIHDYDFGPVVDARSFKGIISSSTDSGSNDDFRLLYSVDGTNWTQLGNDIIAGNGATIEVNLPSAVTTVGNQTLRLRVEDTSQASSERQRGEITIDYLAFSSLTIVSADQSTAASIDQLLQSEASVQTIGANHGIDAFTANQAGTNDSLAGQRQLSATDATFAALPKAPLIQPSFDQQDSSDDEFAVELEDDLLALLSNGRAN